jgi:hypothetical protein
MEYTTMPLSALQNGTTGGYFYHIVNHWWPISSDDQVFFYGNERSPYQSPQCNANRTIAERFHGHIDAAGFVVKEVRLIPIAYQPIQISDYQY